MMHIAKLSAGEMDFRVQYIIHNGGLFLLPPVAASLIYRVYTAFSTRRSSIA